MLDTFVYPITAGDWYDITSFTDPPRRRFVDRQSQRWCVIAPRSRKFDQMVASGEIIVSGDNISLNINAHPHNDWERFIAQYEDGGRYIATDLRVGTDGMLEIIYIKRRRLVQESEALHA